MKKIIIKSKKVPVGRTAQTRDEFLSSGKGKTNIKPNHPKKSDLYRRIGVLASNSNGDMLIVKLDTKGKHSLPDYLNGKSKYKPIVEIEDNEGKRIRIDNIKFVENKPNRDLSQKQVEKISKDCFVRASPKTKKDNLKKLRQIQKGK